MGLPPRPPPSSPRGMLRHGGGPHSLRLPLGSPPRLSRVQHRRRQARRRLHPQPSHGWLFPTLVTAMIPTPNLTYLAILPAVDNLAASHGEFSAIRLYLTFRNSRQVNAIFRNSIVSYFPKFSKGARHVLSGFLSSHILSHPEHVCVLLSIWINLLT